MNINEAQAKVKSFTVRNEWDDTPTVDKFDHLHEELVEMSRHLRYKSAEERIQFVFENKDLFEGEMGDLFFALCRLANQLGIDLEEGFEKTYQKVLKKYPEGKKETNIVREGEPV